MKRITSKNTRAPDGFEVTADLFHGQFYLSRTEAPKLAHWRRVISGGWQLYVNRPLRILRIVSLDERHLGWIVGHAIDAQGIHHATDGDVVYPSRQKMDAADPETWIYGFGGRYIVIWLADTTARVYADPLSTLAVAFSKERKVIASTPTLINWVHDCLEVDLRRALHFHPPNGYFPAGLTYDPAIRRILPNHYLDLSSFALMRHWPHEDFSLLPRRKVKNAVHVTADRMRQLIEGVARTHPLCIATTGGRDSRLVLAAGREVLRSSTFFTLTDKGGSTGAGDLAFSKMFCEKFGLNHVTAPIGQASDRQKLEYALRIGYGGAPAKVNFFDLPLRGLVDMQSAFITAHSGSAAKAYFAQRTGNPYEATSAEKMMRLLGIWNKPEYHEAFRAWHRQLPDVPAPLKLDLLFIEHRDAGWTGVHMYGGAPFDVRIIPFSDRKIYGTQMQLPLHFRMQHRYFPKFIKYAWPQISKLPYVVGAKKKDSLHWSIKKYIRLWLAERHH